MIPNDEHDWNVHDDELGRLVGKKPYVDPDPDLPARIMHRLRPRPGRWYQVLFVNLTRPAISLSPITASAAVVFLILSGGVLYQGLSLHRPPPPAAQKAAAHVPVVFRVRAADAKSVSVIGSFNDWDPSGHEMIQDPRTGDWTIRMELLPGRYDYVFLIDGEEIFPDPNADMAKADGYGHKSSIIFVNGQNSQNI